MIGRARRRRRRRWRRGVNDLLLPIVKGFGSERSYELLGPSRCRPSAAPASCRTTRSSSTSATPRSTPSTRARPRSRARTSSSARSSATRAARSAALLAEIHEFVDSGAGNGRLKEERALLATALDDVQAIVDTMMADLTSAGDDPANLYKVGLNTSRLLMCLGDLVVGWLLLRQAQVALDALLAGEASTGETHFYEGKVAAAKFFAQTRLPLLAAERCVATGTNLEIMELAEAAF